MVLLHVKRGDESQFLLQAPGSTELEELTVQVAQVYNGRLKVQRLCSGAARGGRASPAEPLAEWGGEGSRMGRGSGRPGMDSLVVRPGVRGQGFAAAGVK
jgi:hypothetical protein